MYIKNSTTLSQLSSLDIAKLRIDEANECLKNSMTSVNNALSLLLNEGWFKLDESKNGITELVSSKSDSVSSKVSFFHYESDGNVTFYNSKSECISSLNDMSVNNQIRFVSELIENKGHYSMVNESEVYPIRKLLNELSKNFDGFESIEVGKENVLKKDEHLDFILRTENKKGYSNFKFIFDNGTMIDTEHPNYKAININRFVSLIKKVIECLSAESSVKYRWVCTCENEQTDLSDNSFNTPKECYENMRNSALKKMTWNTEYDEDFDIEYPAVIYRVIFTQKEIQHESFSGKYRYIMFISLE